MNIDPTNFPFIETNRLTLRPLNNDDAEALLKLRSDEQVNRYLDRPPTNTLADALAFIEKITGFLKDGRSLYWVISLKDLPGLIGTIGLWNFDNEKNMAELGYELMPDHQGKGIMNEAMQAVIKYSFDQLQLKTLSAVTHPDNGASSNLLKRNGFVLDELNEFVSKEEAEGLAVYVLLKK